MQPVRQAAARLGVACYDVDLTAAGDKQRFLHACAHALEFPQPFGDNWDAFADCMQDLSWHPARAYAIHLQAASHFARSAPQDYATAIEILRYAADYWMGRGTGFFVLVDDAAELPAFAP
ncbi:MAG: barstar family protein [Betaproteobacteria bacterium]